MPYALFIIHYSLFIIHYSLFIVHRVTTLSKVLNSLQ